MKKLFLLTIFFVFNFLAYAQEEKETFSSSNLKVSLTYNSETTLSDKQLEEINYLPIIDLNEDIRLGEENAFNKGKHSKKTVSLKVEYPSGQINNYYHIDIYYKRKTVVYLACNGCKIKGKNKKKQSGT